MSPRLRRHSMEQIQLPISDTIITVEQLNEWFQVFYRAKKVEGLRPRTLSDHEKHYRYFIQFMVNHHLENTTQEFAFTTDLFRSYVLYMKEQHQYFEGHPNLETSCLGRTGLSPMTINIRLRSIKCFLKFLYTEEYIPHDIALNIKLLKTEKDLIHSFTEEQVKALLAQPDQRTFVGYRDYCLMILLLDTGIRIQEALGLTVVDFEPVRNAITIPAALAKNGHARVVPMSRPTVKLLKELVSENASAFEGFKHIFLSESGTQLTCSGARQRLSKYEQQAGIEGVRTSPHTFRHTFAKFYILNGGDPFTLQRILDHSTMDMVRKYIQMNFSDIEAQHHTFSPLSKIIQNGKIKN